ncbi:MAG: 1-acyl-sn-glycerol-3-phosphate acyltransferase, partial [Lachnospiraceae bacterium]|nr:1-acyl-sn-glycerol-3-phosphate acyltransferase [Lachnospiraceae bacterium]
FKKYYPIVKGNENIPAKGAVAFIGNHRNKLDPAVVAVSSCRKIHWGALLRMFQGKESLFSLRKNLISCYISAAFITAMGAVPIARNTDENYLKINMNSMKKLYQMLTWGGAIGLFPEGTLNRDPQKQNILPLKSNRIFRLIKDNDGIIETFSIVWIPKELNIKNRVIINYGMPINTRNRNVKEILNTWEEMINCGIEESNKLIDELNKIDRGKIDIKERRKKTKDLITRFVNK